MRVDWNRLVPIRRWSDLAWPELTGIQPGDVIVLQETPTESFTRYVTTVLHFNFLGTFIDQKDLQGTSTLNLF